MPRKKGWQCDHPRSRENTVIHNCSTHLSERCRICCNRRALERYHRLMQTPEGRWKAKCWRNGVSVKQETKT